MQLASKGHDLYYTDNKKVDEVDFVIDDYDSLGTILIEVKSGKDYRSHKALDNFLRSDDTMKGVVLSNSGNVECDGRIRYLPVYMSGFL